MTLERKLSPGTLQALEDPAYDEGCFVGKGAVYNNVDSHSDVILPGAFRDWMTKNGDQIVILNQHDTTQPIGIGKLVDTPHALLVEARLNLDLQLARDVFSNLLLGVIKGLSIGFETVEKRIRRDGIRELVKLNLWEISCVTFPSNTRAVVTDVKATDNERELAEALGEVALSMRLSLITVQLASAARTIRPAKAAPSSTPVPNPLANINAAIKAMTAERRVRLGLEGAHRR
jgi:uncharacterized protein